MPQTNRAFVVPISSIRLEPKQDLWRPPTWAGDAAAAVEPEAFSSSAGADRLGCDEEMTSAEERAVREFEAHWPEVWQRVQARLGGGVSRSLGVPAEDPSWGPPRPEQYPLIEPWDAPLLSRYSQQRSELDRSPRPPASWH